MSFTVDGTTYNGQLTVRHNYWEDFDTFGEGLLTAAGVSGQDLDALVNAITSVTFTADQSDGDTTTVVTATMTISGSGAPSIGSGEFASIVEDSTDTTLQAANLKVSEASVALKTAEDAADGFFNGLTGPDAALTLRRRLALRLAQLQKVRMPLLVSSQSWLKHFRLRVLFPRLMAILRAS